MEGVFKDGYFWPDSKWASNEMEDDDFELEEDDRVVKKVKRKKNFCVQANTELARGEHTKFAYTIKISSKTGCTTQYIGFYHKQTDYSNIRGDETGSFAFNFLKGEKCDEGDEASYGRPCFKNEKVSLFLDMDYGRMSIFIDGEDQGVAFKNDKLKSGHFHLSADLYLEDASIKILPPDEAYVKPPKVDIAEIGFSSLLKRIEISEKSELETLDQLYLLVNKCDSKAMVVAKAISASPSRFKDLMYEIAKQKEQEKERKAIGATSPDPQDSQKEINLMYKLVDVGLCSELTMPTFASEELKMALSKHREALEKTLVVSIRQLETLKDPKERGVALESLHTAFNQYPCPKVEDGESEKTRKLNKIFQIKEGLLQMKPEFFRSFVAQGTNQTEADVKAQIIKPLAGLLKEAEQFHIEEAEKMVKNDELKDFMAEMEDLF